MPCQLQVELRLLLEAAYASLKHQQNLKGSIEKLTSDINKYIDKTFSDAIAEDLKDSAGGSHAKPGWVLAWEVNQ